MTVIKKTAEEIENILTGGGWQQKGEYWYHPMFKSEPFKLTQALSVERSRTDKSLEELPAMNQEQLLGYVHKQRARIEELKGVTADDMIKLIKAEKVKEEKILEKAKEPKEERHLCKCIYDKKKFEANIKILDEDDTKQLFAKVKELSNRLETVEKSIDTLIRGFYSTLKRAWKK